METDIWNFWAPRYERLYAQYFALTPTRKLVLEHLRTITTQQSPLRILDLGCGIGQLAAEMADEYPAAAITAIDPSAQMIARATVDYARTNISFHTGTLDDIAGSERFDIIVSTHSFPYVAEKQQAMLRLHSLLNPAGRVIIVQGNTENIYDKLFYLGVKLTVSRAEYLPTRKLAEMMVNVGLTVTTMTPLSSKCFIPSVYLVEGMP